MSISALVILGLASFCSASRILVVSPSPSLSHQIIFQPIWKGLALKGHDVVVITTDPINDPTLENLREIDVGFAYDIWRRNLSEALNQGRSNPMDTTNRMIDTMMEVVEAEMNCTEVQALINNETERFDLVMVELLLPVVLAFKHRFDCPLIGMASTDIFNVLHRAIGNEAHPFLQPDMYHAMDPEEGFLVRLGILAVEQVYRLVFWNKVLSRETEIVKKVFGSDYPKHKYSASTADMVFVNANPVFRNNRMLSQNTIYISGGMHIKEERSLPKDLEKFMSGSKKGVIYFSLGSNVKSENIPAETKRILLKVFSELQYDVLWKFEADELPGKPDNVKIMKWVPQQDVLRHPNVKLFITQGGLQSLEEALFSYVPMIGIPFFADQMFNAKKIKSKGLGLVVENYNFMTEEELKEKILEVIENPKYRNKVKELAILVKDEPMTALEKAVWWTEYVLRHKGAKHLKGPTLPFVQYYYLDILAFLALVFSIILYINYRIIKKCCSLCRSKPKQKEQ